MASSGPLSPVGASAMRKALWRILPLVLLSYLCANMDRANVGFAAVPMNLDLSFSATVYGLGAGLFFLGYALFEIPSNLMAVRAGSRRWLARIMITWGLLSAATLFVRTPLQFYVLRFLLGVAEAGFYPGVIYYFAAWFPASHRSRAVSRFYVAAPLASVVMGGLSGWLLGLNGLLGLRGWQWIFLAEGLPSVFVGLAVLGGLPDAPQTSAWLTAEEKAWIEAELAREAEALGRPERGDLMTVLRNPKVLLLSATGFLYIGATNTLTLIAPLALIALTHLGPKPVGYLVSLGGALGAFTIIFAGNVSDRRGDRFLNACWLSLLMAAGLALMAAALSPLAVVAGYLAVAASSFSVAMLVSSGWAQTLHVSELAVGAAAINSLSQAGAFLMPLAVGAAKDQTGGYAAGLIGLSLAALGSAGLTLRVRSAARRPQALAAIP